MGIRKINENDENNISGGLTYSHGADRERPFEVIDDDDGEVVGRFHSKKEARMYAKLHNYETKEIEWGELDRIRRESRGNNSYGSNRY